MEPIEFKINMNRTAKPNKQIMRKEGDKKVV